MKENNLKYIIYKEDFGQLGKQVLGDWSRAEQKEKATLEHIHA